LNKKKLTNNIKTSKSCKRFKTSKLSKLNSLHVYAIWIQIGYKPLIDPKQNLETKNMHQPTQKTSQTLLLYLADFKTNSFHQNLSNKHHLSIQEHQQTTQSKI
jgi:hypothetical protein